VKLRICYAAYDSVQVILSLCTELRSAGSGRTASLVLNVDTEWKWLSRYTPRPHTSQSRCSRFREQKNPLPLLGIEPKLLGRPASSLISTPAMLCGSVFEKQYTPALQQLSTRCSPFANETIKDSPEDIPSYGATTPPDTSLSWNRAMSCRVWIRTVMSAVTKEITGDIP